MGSRRACNYISETTALSTVERGCSRSPGNTRRAGLPAARNQVPTVATEVPGEQQTVATERDQLEFLQQSAASGWPPAIRRVKVSP